LRAVVCDLDGTLVDSFTAIAASVNQARARFDLQALTREQVLPHVGRGLEPLLADLVGADRVEPAVAAFREHYARVFAESTVLLPGVRETIVELHRRGLRLSVASNKPARFGAPILESLGLLRQFDDVQGPDLAGTTKPDPAMIRQCLLSMEVEAGEAVYVGDMPLDVESARRAGLPAVLVPTGAYPAHELAGLGAVLVDRFTDLSSLFAAHLPSPMPRGYKSSCRSVEGEDPAGGSPS